MMEPNMNLFRSLLRAALFAKDRKAPSRYLELVMLDISGTSWLLGQNKNASPPQQNF